MEEWEDGGEGEGRGLLRPRRERGLDEREDGGEKEEDIRGGEVEE